jgi:N-acetylglucosamine kinase-like BadF-type ATPase
VALYLGIDGGGTKTTCAIGDDNSILATAQSGGSNPIRSGDFAARASLHDAIRQVCARAGVAASAIDSACMGASGGAHSEKNRRLEQILAELLPGKVCVVGDMEIALQAAFGAGPGVITIAGTGSIAFGRDAQGHTLRIGGWGFAISDEGSGHWIGRTAVSRALRARDDGETPALLARIISTWKLNAFDDLIPVANASPPPDFSALFPTVLAVSDAGDPLARTILSDAGEELARLATTVVRRLFQGSEPTVPLAMTGGVFRQSALVRQVFYNRVCADFQHAAVNPTVIEPVRGALALARLAVGQPPAQRETS